MSRDETINASGYAPLGYPQPPPPGYANNAKYPYNPGGAPPPESTAYYASAQLPNNIPPAPISKGYAFARIGLILMIFFMIGSLALCVFTWLVFGSGVPQFKIEAFSVPYFNVTHDNSTLEASWEANITAQNPSHQLDFLLAEIEGILEYRGVVLDLTVIDSLRLGTKSEGKIRATFSVPGPEEEEGNTSGTPASLVRLMEEDRKSGSAAFDVRMIMEATFTSTGTLWSKRSVLRVLCGDIRVNFPSPTGGGTWNGAMGECLTYA